MLYKLILLLTGFYFLSSAFANSWSCSVASNTTFVPNIALAEAQYGSASYLHGDLAEPWPLYTTRDDCKFRGIRYCFENKEAKAALSCKWWAALGLWIRLLGRPGETSGHYLAWQQAGNGEMDPKLRETYYCYSGITGFWDKRVADDTLVIRVITDSSQSGATVGYKGVNGGEHPHSLTLGAKASVPVIAHELGHVLGMVHEHTRNDRDQYVRFNCEALRGYHDALGRAMSLRISPAEAHRRLCEDPEFAKLYGFKSTQYLKNDRLSTTPDKWGALDEPGGYDIRSIMHYSSYAFGDIEDCIASKDYCPLVEIVKDAQGKEVDTRLIPQPVQPSTRDLDWVRRNYCWPADGNCHL